MNTSENQHPQLSPEDATLENELKRLRPASIPPPIREMALQSLESTNLNSEDHALAERLTSLCPAAPSGGLWDSIASQLHDDTSDKVINVPMWRDFAPVFNVAAMVAVGLFAAIAILKPDAQTNRSVSAEAPDAQTNRSVSAEEPNGQLVPISHSGAIQDNTWVRFIEKDEHVYEQRSQTRKDHSHYKFGPDVHVEDEVTRETDVYSPIKTF